MNTTIFPDWDLYSEIRRIFAEKHGYPTIREGYDAERMWLNTSHAKCVKLHKAVCSGKWDADKLYDLILYFDETI